MKQSITNVLLITMVIVLGFVPVYGQNADSTSVDSTLIDIANDYTVDSTFLSMVDYDADDSLIFDYPNSTVYMYGNAIINYEDLELKADYVSFNYSTNNVIAAGRADSSGTIVGKPVFTDNGQSFDADSIKYNFKSKKGIIKQVGTGIADGHVYGTTVKKTEDDVMYIKNGEYCPCEDKNAKTRISTGKIKVIPNEKVVSGPWFLKIGKVPTPLGFFLGYFPNQTGESAGILIPKYGESAQLGFFLIDGGWYQPLGKNADLQVTGDIYTKGSYGMKSIFRYKNRYRFNGNLDLKYNVIKSGISGLPSATETKNTFIRWSHIQDPKARPNTSFNASVNIGSSSTFRNSINTDIQDFLTNTFQSNISYSKRWAGKPYNLAISGNHSQNTQTKIFNLSLPNVTFNLSRVNLPLSFLKSKTNSKNTWYENIGFNYTATASNRITANESALRLDSLNQLINSSRNGIRHSASVSTNINAWHFIVNPSVNFTDRMYFDRLDRSYDIARDQAVIDTIARFSNVYDYSFNTRVTTKLYGMYRFKKGKIKAIRHVMIPSATLNYSPGFDQSITGNFGDSASLITYDPYSIGIYGTTSAQEVGGLALNLQNNVEMKVNSKDKDGNDASKKIKLIDAFSLSSFYNVFKDSVKWSNVNTNFRTSLFKKVNITANAVFNPYQIDTATGQNINTSLYKSTGKLAKMRNANLAVGYNFRLSDLWDKFNEKTVNLSTNANVNYTYSSFYSTSEKQYNESFTKSMTFSGDLKFLTRFSVGYFTGYDFVAKQMTPTTLNLYVDLNCWEFRVNYIPTGFLKSVQVSLNMKSAILKDVKIQRRKNLSDNNGLLF
jgi:lipopolysaccharide assembly outer membrane protein LptD (OstA)